MRKTDWGRAALVCGSLSLASVAAAAPHFYAQHHRLCDGTESAPPPQVVIGCPFVSAGLGCPAGAPLQLSVHLDAPAGATVNLGVSNTSGLTLIRSGTVSAISAGSFQLKPGDGSIRGFFADTSPAPRILATVLTNASMLTPAASGGSDPTVAITLRFVQAVGTQRVREDTVTHIYHLCPAGSATTGDQIKLGGNAPDHDGIAVIDGHRGTSCLKDEKFRGRTTISLGNLIPNDTSCPAPSRATLFTANGAVDFRPELNWFSGNDTLLVNLSAPVTAKLKVWLLYDLCHPTSGQCICKPASCTAEGRRKFPLQITLEAIDRYQKAFGGVAFTHELVDLSQPAELRPSLRSAVAAAINVAGCSNDANADSTLAKLEAVTSASSYEIGGELNVFIVRSATALGWWCGRRSAGKDVIVVNTFIPAVTLAHEIGHALLDCGDHTQVSPGAFTSDNMMLASPGNMLTLGQVFRMNVDADSPLNRHGWRDGPTLQCPTSSCSQWLASSACPAASLDELPR